MEYPVIDMKRTGEKIKSICRENGISAREIREYMNFSSVQSVYDWFRGKNMPSLDNFYALSRFLHVSMEQLICASDQARGDQWIVLFKADPARVRFLQKERLSIYKNKISMIGKY